MTVDFSVVIPTWNRSGLVDDLLRTLKEDRDAYDGGKVEVLIVDSSVGEEKESIMRSCSEYGAEYIEGPDSVRKKRNMGISNSRYDHILFLDSDVMIEPGMLKAHADTYENSNGEPIGGTFGRTVFYGKRNFVWKVTEYTHYTDVFNQAALYPYVNWTICNNVSFVKQYLLDIGMFEENLPFKLGGDDLDLSYRVVASGHPIKSCPDAVTLHSRDTWSTAKAIMNRTVRWGSMEYHNGKRHPEIMRKTLPGLPLMSAIFMCMIAIGALVLGDPKVLLLAAAVPIYSFIISYYYDGIRKGKWNPVLFLTAKILLGIYGLCRYRQYIKHRDLSLVGRTMIFDIGHARAEYSSRSCKMDCFILFSAVAIIIGLLLMGAV